MKSALRSAAGFALIAVLGSFAVAQVPSRPTMVGSGQTGPLSSLAADYLDGRWALVQTKMDGLLAGQTVGGHVIDPKKHFYLIVFLSLEKGEAPRQIRFVWHKPLPDPYAARIPGSREIFEIVLGAGSDFELKTSYLSTELANPILDDIPKFVRKVEPFVAEWVKSKTDRIPEQTVPFQVRRIALPYSRAKIKIADTAVLGGEGKALDDEAAAGAKEIRASFDFENAPLKRFSFGVISAYMLSLAYAPDRIRLTEDGYYASDPPKYPLTAAILNIHPVAYDPESVKMRLAERLRLFAGVTITPDPGFCAGAGIAILRGLTVNAGVALMGFRMANNPRALVVGGQAKTMPGDVLDPFKSNWKAVAFVAVGYNF